MQMLDIAAAGTVLREARHARDLTLQKVAETIDEPGLDRATLSKMELGQVKPTERYLGLFQKAALLFDVELPYKRANGEYPRQASKPRRQQARRPSQDVGQLADAFITCFCVLSDLDKATRRRVLFHLNAKFQ